MRLNGLARHQRRGERSDRRRMLVHGRSAHRRSAWFGLGAFSQRRRRALGQARGSRRTLPIVLACLAGAAQAAPHIVPDPPPISSKGYVLMAAGTGRVLAQRDSTAPLPPASLTKIMTSYVAAAELAAGRISLDDDVPISVKAWQTGGSRMFVREGTTVKLADLLRGVVIQSGNDASVAVAEFIAGDEDAFGNMMNVHAKELGLTDSRFVNATGLPDDGHYSSARDLAVLSAALIERYPEHYAMYSERSFTFAEIEQPNRNKLLWRDKSVDGVKTGLTDAAGYCLVASALRDGTRLIAATMGAETDGQRFQDAQKLIAYGFRYFENRQLYEAGEVLATPAVWFGSTETVAVGVEDALTITLPRGRYDDLQPVVDLPRNIEAPIEVGQRVGTVRVTLDEDVLAELPLVAQAAVPEANVFARMGDSIYLFFRDLLAGDVEAPNGTSP